MFKVGDLLSESSMKRFFAGAGLMLWGLALPSFAAPTPEIIGNYNNGCISGSVKANLKSPYYQIYHPQNKRYYGHRSIMEFLDRLSVTAHKLGFESLLVGNISSEYGGPVNTGHASHQTGLDVDIEFNHRRLSDKELRSRGHAHILVDRGGKTANQQFTRAYYELIMAAAHDPAVERIFVSPAIKVTMCDMTTDEREQPFLRKIRPWYGHTEHFHVRLRCPEDAVDCERQLPPTPKKSIAEEKEEALTWFEPAPANAPKPVRKPKPPLPEKCQLLFDRLKIKY